MVVVSTWHRYHKDYRFNVEFEEIIDLVAGYNQAAGTVEYKQPVEGDFVIVGLNLGSDGEICHFRCRVVHMEWRVCMWRSSTDGLHCAQWVPFRCNLRLAEGWAGGGPASSSLHSSCG